MGCNRNTIDVHIAIEMPRAVIHVLVGVPPSVPPSGVPLVSVLRSMGVQASNGVRSLDSMEGSAVGLAECAKANLSSGCRR